MTTMTDFSLTVNTNSSKLNRKNSVYHWDAGALTPRMSAQRGLTQDSGLRTYPMRTYNPVETRYDSIAYQRCGGSGLKLPAISLGLWHNFGGVDRFEDARAMVQLNRIEFRRGYTFS